MANASNKKYTPEEIDYIFDAFREYVSEKQRIHIAKALSILDTDLIDKIADEVVFVASNETFSGMHFPLDSKGLKGKKAIIFLPQWLFKSKVRRIKKTILHEVAHYILNHKWFYDFEFKDMKGYKKARKKKVSQEREADMLAEKWLAEA